MRGRLHVSSLGKHSGNTVSVISSHPLSYVSDWIMRSSLPTFIYSTRNSDGAEPRPAQGTVNTMNNLSSEARLYRLRVHRRCSCPALLKQIRAWKNLRIWDDVLDIKVYFTSHACMCWCPGDCCETVSGQNGSGSAVGGGAGRLAYCFPSLVKEKATSSSPLCWAVCGKRTHERRAQNTFWGVDEFDNAASLMKVLLCELVRVCV